MRNWRGWETEPHTQNTTATNPIPSNPNIYTSLSHQNGPKTREKKTRNKDWLNSDNKLKNHPQHTNRRCPSIPFHHVFPRFPHWNWGIQLPERFWVGESNRWRLKPFNTGSTGWGRKVVVSSFTFASCFTEMEWWMIIICFQDWRLVHQSPNSHQTVKICQEPNMKLTQVYQGATAPCRRPQQKEGAPHPTTWFPSVDIPAPSACHSLQA